MDRPSHLPENLDKNSLKWLRCYGYSLNANDDRFRKIRELLKKWYPYEYYFYVDIELAQEARKKSELLRKEDFIENPKKYYTTWNNLLKSEKRRIIKELYGLEKKGIR